MVTEKNRVILSDDVKPVHYDLNMEVDMESFNFVGKSTVSLIVNRPTNRIEFNVKNLSIDRVYIMLKDKELTPSHMEMDDVFEVVRLGFDQVIEEKHIRLYIEFSSEIKDVLSGFYRCSYVNKDGETKYMAVTHFEPTDARRAFPCWDEPNIKSTFSIKVSAKKPNTVLSNMNCKSKVELDNSIIEYTFGTTPIMSTYLVAIIVGELEYVECFTGKRNIPLRVYVPSNTEYIPSKMCDFPLEVGNRVLKYFEDYFDIEYPLPKMDMVAIPNFAMGAMENWGLITYRTTALLFDPKKSSLRSKMIVADVVSHELAHQWFGNLVTMDWWSDLWLNEGFATWVGTLAVASCFPSWNFWRHFILEDMFCALKCDSSRSSRPIFSSDLSDPRDINQIFDEISYSKGASLIRMLSFYLSPKVFKEGLRSYLKLYKNKNAETNDLWKALESVSEKPVEKIMDLWTRKVGYPIISVDKEEYDEQNQKLLLTISQRRYLLSNDVCEDEDQTVWYVPLNLRIVNRDENGISGPQKDCNSFGEEEADVADIREALLDERKKTFVFDNVKSGYRYKLNSGHISFYMTNYGSGQIFDHTLSLFKEERLSIKDVIGILNDVSYLCTSGDVESTKSLELALTYYRDIYHKEYKNYPNYLVFSSLVDILDRPRTLWSIRQISNESIAILTNARNRLCLPLCELLGLKYKEGEEEDTVLLRTLCVGFMVHGDSFYCRKLGSMFESYYDSDFDPKIVDPSLRLSVFMAAMKSHPENYDRMYSIYKKSTVPDLKAHALMSLTFSNRLVDAKNTLELTLKESEISMQDLLYVFRGFSHPQNPIYAFKDDNGKPLRMLWQFMKDNWSNYFYPRLSDGSSPILTSILSSALSTLCSLDDLKDVKEFFADKDTKLFHSVLDKSLEKMRVNAMWVDREGPKVDRWLLDNKDRWVNDDEMISYHNNHGFREDL